MHDKLINTLEQLAPLTPDEKELVKSIFVPFSLKKKDHFLIEGKKNRKIGFLLKGLVYYYISKDGEERIINFSDEGEFITEYQTFIMRENATLSIRAVEDCELLIVSYENLQKFYNETSNGHKIGRLVVEHRFRIIINQLISLYKDNPQERYLNFIQHYKPLVQRIPQYLIASYTGVKPQSLSRIRNRIVKSTS